MPRPCPCTGPKKNLIGKVDAEAAPAAPPASMIAADNPGERPAEDHLIAINRVGDALERIAESLDAIRRRLEVERE